MVSFFPVNITLNSRKVYVVLLACAWFCGLLGGMLTAVFADDSFFSLMRRAPGSHVSIVGLLTTLLLPLLLSAFALYISQHWFLIILAFIKAFELALIGTGVAVSYGSGGWLVSFLFLCADVFSVPVFIWFWLFAFCEPSKSLRRGIGVFLFVLLIGCLNYRFVSPFLANLLTM